MFDRYVILYLSTGNLTHWLTE